ncbi:NACHT domain-containing protein [Flavobacterium sp. PL02]|uniref:NACHT domain-containing protein n=1 Tax=Flavobacterium sp. PL02 TaxID=3088354 RepID=UPI002B23077B|nr:NACHT domain-containing protein [Flavobacterium sp. PL02]MEA9411905.1 NACHT domain-containing protein [Flavobacterium sp. PL02]
MTTAIGIQLLGTFKDPLSKISKDLKDEFLHVFNNGLPEYIDNFYDKYSKTKTFIYRDEKVNFYDIFFPVNIKSNTKIFDLIGDLKVLFKKGNYITIIGSAGSGKSMLMKHIFLSTVKQSFRIPIVIELRNLTDFNGNITDYVSSILTRNQLGKSPRIVDRILKEGNFIFLLDGYDEIYSSAKNRITNDIEEFVDMYSKNIFVLTSRPGSNAESLQRFDNYYVQALDSVQIDDFIKQQFKNHENEESLERILSVIKKTENEDYRDYLTNPLLLSMFIFTFNAYPELPKYKSKFYWNVFDTLCTKHDSFTKKGFWLHERKSNLLNDDFENILKWLSYATIFKGKYNFDYEYFKKTLLEILSKLGLKCELDNLIYDLTVSISIIIQDGTDYTFPHKSLQEYFTASLIKGLNDPQKQKVYSEKFEQIENFSTGGKINLYKLCQEMDKIYFSKMFLIPKAENFISKLDITSDNNLVLSFFNVASPFFMFSNNKISAYSQGIYIEDSFLSFFGVKNYFPEFETLDKHSHLILNALDKTKNFNVKTINLSKDLPKQKLLEFLSKTGIKENIIVFFKTLLLNLEAMKQDLEKENSDTDDLLEV